jgi:hypothetical protein
MSFPFGQYYKLDETINTNTAAIEQYAMQDVNP